MKYIGIIGRLDENTKFNQEIVNIIYKYGFIPLGIIANFNEDSNKIFENIKPIINLCSGFILQGGSEYYDIDKLVVKYLYESDIPTLGICLGMQTMAMVFNGQMGSIAKHLSNDLYVHDINIVSNTYLHKIIGKNNIMVNSRHKDSIIVTDLKVSAESDVVEGIEDSSKKFFIGVQWHPETLMDDNSCKLFGEFFKKCT